jgi:acyl carrier protein
MAEMTDFEFKLATLMCEVLNLEDVNPADINPQEPLFDGGLDLDSIDALEIAVAIAQEYNVHLKAEDEQTRNIFATLRNLANHINQETGAPST